MFGKYELMERLGKGGMAEVYLARMAGPLGISRFVALKRMLADLPSERGSSMFVDEMRLAVRLSHPNIVQVYDFGVENDQYFLAMEFVEGRDVHQILKYASRKQPPAVDVESALYMIAAVSRGLDYAHRLHGPDGRAAQIVHRDVSPANIMVTYTGDVKLADFGIARAAQHLRMTNTEAGEIKGKIRYMSPEQARGEAVDYRTDLFALGIILLELLTLAPAFAAESDIASLLRVQEGIPKDWDVKKKHLEPDILAIIEQAMAVQKDNRYGSGEMMAQSCELALRRRNPGYGPAQLAAYMHSMFAREQSDWRARMAAYERQPAGGIPENSDGTSEVSPRIMKALSNDSGPPSKPGTISEIPRDHTAPISGVGTGAGTAQSLPGLSPDMPRPPTLQTMPSGQMSVGAVVNTQTSQTQATTVSPPPVMPTTGPHTPVAAGQLEQPVLTMSVRPRTLGFWLGGGALVAALVGAVVWKQTPHEPVDKPVPVVNPQPVIPPPVNPPVNPPVAKNAPGRLVLTTNAMSTRVFLDPSPAERSPVPVAAGGMSFKVDVPSGRVWTLRVEADGFKTVSLPLVIGAGEETNMPVLLSPDTAPVPVQVPVQVPRGNSSGGRPRPKKVDNAPQQAPQQAPQKPPPAETNPNLVNPF
jgi:serine/threonine-protein kinase